MLGMFDAARKDMIDLKFNDYMKFKEYEKYAKKYGTFDKIISKHPMLQKEWNVLLIMIKLVTDPDDLKIINQE